MDADFLFGIQLIHEVLIGSPALEIVGVSRNTGSEKLYLIIVCGKRYRRKEHSHISHSSHRHALIIYILIQLVTSHDGIVVAAVPEGDVQIAVLGVNRLLLKVLSVTV